MVENCSHRLAVELGTAGRVAGQLRDTLRNLLYAVQVSPASDPSTPFEALRESLLIPWRREMEPLLKELGEATEAGADLLRNGAGRVADGERWQGSDAWSARLFRRLESVRLSMASLDAWSTALVNEGTTYGLMAGFPNALATSRLNAEAEAAADLAAAMWESFTTLYSCIETNPSARTSDGLTSEQNGIKWHPASWYMTQFGIPESRLREAARNGRLAKRKSGPSQKSKNLYQFSDVQNLWPGDVDL